MEESPAKLLVGSDAVQYAAAVEDERRTSDKRRRELSESVAFEDAR